MLDAIKAAKRIAAVGLFTVGVAAPLHAADLSLRCDLAQVQDGAALSKSYVIRYKDGAANVSIYDSWIKRFVGEPLLARVTRDDANSLVFKWELHGVSGAIDQSASYLRYRGTYLRKSGQFDVRAQPGGHDPLPGARGRCRQVK
ncbi:hypothetical protein N4R57_07055 [Rhodobacteraceae bacterium D3-12]|nr:hypothetical protein N4R57_07055 [Rhodobacteraceae bacterium D3-12]